MYKLHTVMSKYDEISQELKDFLKANDYVLEEYSPSELIINENPNVIVLDELKESYLESLKIQFNQFIENAVLDTDLGFKINANMRAALDIDGLIETTNDVVNFCDANNVFHEVSLNDLKKMKHDILVYHQKLYQKKWQIRDMINNASTNNEVMNIMIDFNGVK